jgi:hypothetical protein
MNSASFIPDNLEDLNSRIRKALGNGGRDESEEKAAIYTRVSRLDKHHHGYSMEIQPDRSEEYVRTKG